MTHHQQQEIEVPIPQEIRGWILDRLSRMYIMSEIGGKPMEAWERGAIAMYRHLAPEITQLRQAAEILKMVRNES